MNDRVKIVKKELLSDNWYTLNKIVFDYTQNNGEIQRQEREAYDRGNGSTILLYNKKKETVVLTRQFRMPTYLNGNESGFLIEACAGLLEEDNAEDCIKKETEEETGYRLTNVRKVFESYMSPGSVTEILYFFLGEYEDNMKVNSGGGTDEGEDIEVLEIPFREVIEMVKSGEIKDGKTIMLIQYAQLHGIIE